MNITPLRVTVESSFFRSYTHVEEVYPVGLSEGGVKKTSEGSFKGNDSWTYCSGREIASGPIVLVSKWFWTYRPGYNFLDLLSWTPAPQSTPHLA